MVGLQLYLGEQVKVATEIMEVGKDVVKRIEERREHRTGHPEGKDQDGQE